MINSKTEYYEYLEADRQANKKKKIHAHLFGDYTYNYLNLMRKLEYYTNCKSDIISKIYRKFLNARYKRLSVKTGIQIGINSFGKGLALFHYGSIIANGTAQFGEFCVVQSDVNVSAGVRGGNEVYIAPGVKILENIAIADNVIIGANAVVCKDIEEPHTSWGGIPAKKISEKGFEFKM